LVLDPPRPSHPELHHLSMRPNLSFLALVCAATGFLPGCTSGEPPPAKPVSGADSEPHALGLRPPTAAERARLAEISKKNPPTVPNELARERLDAERKARGLPPLPAEAPNSAPAPVPK